MKIAFVIIGIIILAIFAFLTYRTFAFQAEGKKFNEECMMRIQPLYEKLKNGQTLTKEDIFLYAQDIKTREITYKFLKENNMTDLFPKEYYTIVNAAETNLVNWLMFPTELGVCPNEIDYIKRVSIDFDGENHFVHYEVFKYRVNEPHRAAKDGWTLGVVGPYFDDSQPYEHFPSSTFSRGSPMDKISPEMEVEWVHKNISLKR